MIVTGVSLSACLCVERREKPPSRVCGARGDRTRAAGHGRHRTQHQRNASSTRERRQSTGDSEPPLRLGRRRPHYPRRPYPRGFYSNLYHLLSASQNGLMWPQ